MASYNRFYLRHQVTPYVILFIERDGSTYLTSLLTSHPDVNAIFERFAVMKQKGENAADQLRWANNFFTPPIIGRKAAIGFKTKLVDVMDLEGFARLLTRKKCHIVQMQRVNRIKAVVSRINAKRLHDASGKWNLYNETDRMPAVVIDLEEFDRNLKEREAADEELNAYVNRLGLPTLKIHYEDLLRERDKALQGIFSFLGLRAWNVRTKTLKNTKDDLREAVANFDELRARYAGTQYELMFDEVLLPMTS
jgi:LPS sulfotransferase NodH